MTPNEHPKPVPTRMIDSKLPLTWLIASAFAVVTAFAYNSFTVDRLREDVSDLKTTVKALAAISAETALLRYRVERLESERRTNTPGTSAGSRT